MNLCIQVLFPYFYFLKMHAIGGLIFLFLFIFGYIKCGVCTVSSVYGRGREGSIILWDVSDIKNIRSVCKATITTSPSLLVNVRVPLVSYLVRDLFQISSVDDK